MPPFDFNQNPAIPETMPSNRLQAPQSQQGGYNQDFSGQLNDMLAPYQQMAQKMQSPYATMSQNSWLARNHPQVAGILDNAFLTMGSTPGPQGPEGVGGGISRAMQGLMGAQQYRRQQMMQNMMIPYQMMMPQLQAKDLMGQISEREAMVPYRIAQEKYMQSRDENYQSLMAGRDRQKALAGPDMTDDKGNAWSRIFDPVSGRVSLRHAVTGQDASELPADQRPTFENEKKDSRRGTPGGMMGEIIEAQMSKDPTIHAKGVEMGKIYSSLYGQQAGARTGAEVGITEPIKTADQFYAQERQTAYSNLPKPMTPQEYHTMHEFDTGYYKKSGPQKDAEYDTYFKGEQGKKQQVDVDLTKWKKSSAFTRGVSFSEYQQDPSKWDRETPSQLPPEAANAPRAVDKAWTYKP